MGSRYIYTDIQQYIREREHKDGKEATGIIYRYFRSKDIDEQKYMKSKPWIYKSVEERQREKGSPLETTRRTSGAMHTLGGNATTRRDPVTLTSQVRLTDHRMVNSGRRIHI